MQLFFGIIFWIAVAAIIYSWKKSKAIQQENLEDFETNEEYQKFKKITKIAAVVCVVSFLLYHFVDSTDEKEIKSLVTEVQTQSFEMAKLSVKNSNLKQDITFDKIKIDGDSATVNATFTIYDDKSSHVSNAIFRLRKVDGKWTITDIK